MKKTLYLLSLSLCFTLLTGCKRANYECLSFTALEDSTSFYALHSKEFNKNDLPNISYSKDMKAWHSITISDESKANYISFITLNKNEKVYLKGNNPNGFSKSDKEFVHFIALDNNENDVKFSCDGSVMSLIDDGYCLTSTIPCDYCFTRLFSNTDYASCRLINTPYLPATTLKKECYSYMFFDNAYVTTSTMLPSLKMEEKCYAYMYAQCVSLKRAPILKATKTAPYCYDHMFYGNSSLEFIEVHINSWDREGDFPCCFWVSFDGAYPMSTKGLFRCKKELIPNKDDKNNFSETRVPYSWTIETF